MKIQGGKFHQKRSLRQLLQSSNRAWPILGGHFDYKIRRLRRVNKQQKGCRTVKSLVAFFGRKNTPATTLHSNSGARQVLVWPKTSNLVSYTWAENRRFGVNSCALLQMYAAVYSLSGLVQNKHEAQHSTNVSKISFTSIAPDNGLWIDKQQDQVLQGLGFCL